MTTNIVINDSCLTIPEVIEPESIDAVVTDPPYEIGVGGLQWDKTGIALDKRVWEACMCAMKPGAIIVVFSAPRMYHRVACTVEGVGFEIIDMGVWRHKGGMARGQSTARQIDAYKIYGATNSKALRAVADNYGAGKKIVRGTNNGMFGSKYERFTKEYTPIHEEAEEYSEYGSRLRPMHEPMMIARKPMSGNIAQNVLSHGVGSFRIAGTNCSGNIFEFSKPSKDERTWNRHKTAKPLALMESIIHLVMPPSRGVVLDPFSGGGTTGRAAKNLGHDSVCFEVDSEVAKKSIEWISQV